MFANFILAEEEEMMGRERMGGGGGSGIKKKGLVNLKIQKFPQHIARSQARAPGSKCSIMRRWER